jgi:hypothetical protein
MIDTQSYHTNIAVNMQNSYSRITIVTRLWAGQLRNHHSNPDRGKRFFLRPNVIYIYIYIYDISGLRVNDLTLMLLTRRKW